ncbi:MAG: hypothetical protein ABI091_03305 [Ferruginibacter sp.]
MNAPTIYISKEISLPDNDQWQHRFNIKSESSDRLYTIAQNKKHRHWGCSCMAYKRYRYCKHLTGIGLPVKETPYEPKIIND